MARSLTETMHNLKGLATARRLTEKQVVLRSLQEDVVRYQDLRGNQWAPPAPDRAPSRFHTGQWPVEVADGGESSVAVIEMPDKDAIGTVAIEVSDEALNDNRNRLAMEAEALLGFTALREKVKAPSQLRCVLAKLQIEVLDARQVKEYKAQASGHMRTANKMSDPTWVVTPLAEYRSQIPEFVLSKALEVKRELPAANFFVEHLQEDPFLIVTTRPVEQHGRLLGRHGSLGSHAIAYPEDVMYLEVWDEKSFEAGL